jgi:four helix bundle protein
MFTHEKFEAYQLAIQFTHLALQCLDEMSPPNAHLRDQLRRAAFSISLNIAEGTGKNGRADRIRFYSVARGSAMECAAICDIIGIMDTRLLPTTELAKAKLKSIVNILSTVCSSRCQMRKRRTVQVQDDEKDKD